MVFNKFRKTIFFILLIFSSNIFSAIIIWDLHDTLTTIKKSEYLSYIGKKEITKFYFQNLIEGNCGSFFHRLFDFGTHIKCFYLTTLSQIPSPYKRPEYIMKDPTGMELPPLLQDFMLGKMSAKEIIAIGDDWIAKNENYFISEREKNIFQSIFHVNFDPEIYMNCNCTTKYFPLFKKAFKKRDKNGYRKNKCIILSNWAKEWIPLLKNKFPEIYKYSDYQIFSCNEDCAKPCPSIYKKCLSLYPECKNEPCIFFDDQEENRQAAEKLGIISVHPEKAEKTLKYYRAI